MTLKIIRNTNLKIEIRIEQNKITVLILVVSKKYLIYHILI